MSNEVSDAIMGKPLGKVAICVLLLAFAVLTSVIVHAYLKRLPFKQTEEIVKEEAKRSKSARRKPGMLEREDAWGNPLCLNKEKMDMAIRYEVISPGPDAKFGTLDDISAEAIDLNKSRMVGTWAGEKIKEGFKGFTDGLKKKSEFEEE